MTGEFFSTAVSTTAFIWMKLVTLKAPTAYFSAVACSSISLAFTIGMTPPCEIVWCVRT